ncbi:hypothetical protein BDV3_002419 [Batrachochytrium dendrobatidis]
MEFPRWTFPFNNNPIKFGTLTSVGMHLTPEHIAENPSDSADSPNQTTLNPAQALDSISGGLANPVFIHENIKKRYTSLSKIIKTFPRSYMWERRVLPKNIHLDIGSMLAYYDASYYDAYVPLPLLDELVTEQIKMEFEYYKFDYLDGNRLHSWQTPDRRTTWLAHPTGQLLNQLCIRKMINNDHFIHTFSTHGKLSAFHVFDTPILQIVSSSSTLSVNGPDHLENSNDLFAVRTFQGAHFFKLELDKKGMAYADLKREFAMSPHVLDLTFNPVIPGYVASIQLGGTVQIWDAQHDGMTMWRKENPNSDTLTNYQLWKSCQFGVHPRTLLVAHSKQVEICDLRSPPKFPISNVFNDLGPKEYITGMDRNPNSPFEIALVTTDRAIVVDTRYTKYPMLHWGLNHPIEYQFHIKYLNNLGNRGLHQSGTNHLNSTFATWSRTQTEILFYDYEATKSNPPVTVGVQKLVSYPTHPHVLFPPMETMPCLPRRSDVKHNDHEISQIIPPWAPLVGFEVIPNIKNDGFTLLHLACDGALYAQAYGVDSTADDKHDQHDTALENNQVEQKLDKLESSIYKIEVKNLGNQKIETGTIKSHRLVDMRILSQITNEIIQDQLLKDYFKTVDVTSDIVLDGTIQNIRNIFATHTNSDQADTILPTRASLTSFYRQLKVFLSDPTTKAKFPDMTILDPGNQFMLFGFNTDLKPQTLNELKEMIKGILICDESHDMTPSKDGSLLIGDQASIRLLARDMWFSRMVMIPTKTTVESLGDTSIASDTVSDMVSDADEAQSVRGDNTDYRSDSSNDIQSTQPDKSTPVRRSLKASRSSQRPTQTTDTTQSMPPINGLLRSADTGNPIIKPPATFCTPLCSKPFKISGSISTFKDMWDHPEFYYDPNAVSENFKHGMKQIVVDPRQKKRKLNSSLSAAEGAVVGTGANGSSQTMSAQNVYTQEWASQQTDMGGPSSVSLFEALEKSMSQPAAPMILSTMNARSTQAESNSQPNASSSNNLAVGGSRVSGTSASQNTALDQRISKSQTTLKHGFGNSQTPSSAKKQKKSRTKGF